MCVLASHGKRKEEGVTGMGALPVSLLTSSVAIV